MLADVSLRRRCEVMVYLLFSPPVNTASHDCTYRTAHRACTDFSPYTLFLCISSLLGGHVGGDCFLFGHMAPTSALLCVLSCFFVFFSHYDRIFTPFTRRRSQKPTPKPITRLWTRTGKGVGKLTCGAIPPVYFHTGCKFIM